MPDLGGAEAKGGEELKQGLELSQQDGGGHEDNGPEVRVGWEQDSRGHEV